RARQRHPGVGRFPTDWQDRPGRRPLRTAPGGAGRASRPAHDGRRPGPRRPTGRGNALAHPDRPRPGGRMTIAPPTRHYAYETDGAQIYIDSFAAIRAEADLSAIPVDAETVAVRMIHACGQTDLARDLVIHPGLVSSARSALESCAPILTDAHMFA